MGQKSRQNTVLIFGRLKHLAANRRVLNIFVAHLVVGKRHTVTLICASASKFRWRNSNGLSRPSLMNRLHSKHSFRTHRRHPNHRRLLMHIFYTQPFYHVSVSAFHRLKTHHARQYGVVLHNKVSNRLDFRFASAVLSRFYLGIRIFFTGRSVFIHADMLA